MRDLGLIYLMLTEEIERNEKGIYPMVVINKTLILLVNLDRPMGGEGSDPYPPLDSR